MWKLKKSGIRTTSIQKKNDNYIKAELRLEGSRLRWYGHIKITD